MSIHLQEHEWVSVADKVMVSLFYSFFCPNVVTFELDGAEHNVDGPHKQIQSQERLPLHLNVRFISILASNIFPLTLQRFFINLFVDIPHTPTTLDSGQMQCWLYVVQVNPANGIHVPSYSNSK